VRLMAVTSPLKTDTSNGFQAHGFLWDRLTELGNVSSKSRFSSNKRVLPIKWLKAQWARKPESVGCWGSRKADGLRPWISAVWIA